MIFLLRSGLFPIFFSGFLGFDLSGSFFDDGTLFLLHLYEIGEVVFRHYPIVDGTKKSGGDAHPFLQFPGKGAIVDLINAAGGAFVLQNGNVDVEKFA